MKKAMQEIVFSEVEKAPGVDVSFEKRPRSGHFKAVLSYGGRTRFVVVGGTPSDRRAGLNLARDIRAQLRELGALQ